MVQFAADDDIDATLHDVTAALQTSATAPGESAAWRPTGETTHLHYAGDGNLQYVPDGTGYPQTLGADAGWSRLTVTAVHGTQHGQQPPSRIWADRT